MARSFTPCVLTANDLLEGDVVYLAPGRSLDAPSRLGTPLRG